MAIKTGKVRDRRQIEYSSLQQLLDEAEHLASAGHRTLGNWSLGQVLAHLAAGMKMSIDGFEMKVPLPARILGPLFLKRRFLKRGMPSGFQLPPSAKALLPDEATSVEDGLQQLRDAIERLKSETARSPHPMFGSMSREESDRMQLRHAELHMSFVVPA